MGQDRLASGYEIDPKAAATRPGARLREAAADKAKAAVQIGRTRRTKQIETNYGLPILIGMLHRFERKTKQMRG